MSVPHETVLLPRSRGDPLRFPGAWVYAWRVARAAARIARAAPGEVILVPQDALATGAGAVLAGRRTRTPVVVMDHGSAIVYRTAFFWRERALAVATRRAHPRAVSPRIAAHPPPHHASRRDPGAPAEPEAMERFAADGVRRQRIARYHVPIDLARFRPPDPRRRLAVRGRLGVAEDEVLALSIGRLTPEKGLDVLVDAVAALPVERRPVLAIGGIGPMRAAIEARAATRGIDVRMLGEVRPDDLPDLIGAADLVAYASRQGTNVPVAILEAMACGRLVVATDQPPAAHELLADGRGIVVPAGEVEPYAEALRTA